MLREAPPGLVKHDVFNEMVNALRPLFNLMTTPPLYAAWTPGALLLWIDQALNSAQWMKVTDYEALGANKWRYSAQPIKNLGLGGHAAGNWEATGDPVDAYNLIEVGNDGSGVEMNGVNVSRMAPGGAFEGFSIQPVPVGAIVRAYAVPVQAGGSEWWFSYENAVDGTCPE